MHYLNVLLISLKLQLHINIIDLQRKYQNIFIKNRCVKKINLN